MVVIEDDPRQLWISQVVVETRCDSWTLWLVLFLLETKSTSPWTSDQFHFEYKLDVQSQVVSISLENRSIQCFRVNVLWGLSGSPAK